MNPQDGLYTDTEHSAAGSATRLVDAVREVLVAASQGARLAALLAAQQTRIVSFTVTEKGYCRTAAGGLDLAQAAQGSFYQIVAEVLGARRSAGARPG